jgi:hypothetical protein
VCVYLYSSMKLPTANRKRLSGRTPQLMPYRSCLGFRFQGLGFWVQAHQAVPPSSCHTDPVRIGIHLYFVHLCFLCGMCFCVFVCVSGRTPQLMSHTDPGALTKAGVGLGFRVEGLGQTGIHTQKQTLTNTQPHTHIQILVPSPPKCPVTCLCRRRHERACASRARGRAGVRVRRG